MKLRAEFEWRRAQATGPPRRCCSLGSLVVRCLVCRLITWFGDSVGCRVIKAFLAFYRVNSHETR